LCYEILRSLHSLRMTGEGTFAEVSICHAAGGVGARSHMLTEIVLKPIGTVHSPFKAPPGTPIQPGAAAGIQGTVEVFPEYRQGLKDLEGFSHLILLYYFHLAPEFSLLVQPFLDNQKRGLFATRAPAGAPGPETKPGPRPPEPRGNMVTNVVILPISIKKLQYQ
jgi:hypothetical protein